jgi:hypothetical protein
MWLFLPPKNEHVAIYAILAIAVIAFVLVMVWS